MSVIVPPASGSTPMDLSTEKTITLLSQTTVADATSTAFDVTSMATVRLTISPTSYTGTITFYASEDGTNYIAISGRKQGTKTDATSITLSGSSTRTMWGFSVAGFKRFRLATTSSSGTSISITGRGSPLASSEALISTPSDTTIGGTTAPAAMLTVGGKTNDVTPQYHPIPEGAAGRSIIVEGYAGGTAQPISAASLPLPTGAATAAKQPALGTAGTASADVITVQGVASMTPLQATDGGTTATAIAAGTAGNTVIKASAGRLCRILVTTAGTNALMVYDNATTNTGTIIGAVAANAVAGTWVDAQMPAANGITVDGDGNNPAVTISFS